MFRIFYLLLFFFASNFNAHSQSVVFEPKFLKIEINKYEKELLLKSIDSLFKGVENESIDSSLIDSDNFDLTISILNYLKGNQDSKKLNLKNFYRRQLINVYELSPSCYFISIAYIGSKSEEYPILKTCFNIIAKIKNGKTLFSIPTNYLTRNWKTTSVGNVRYFYEGNINLKRAKKFDSKNTRIAEKFNLKPEKIDFYLCDNFQEVKKLLGFGYDISSNGEINNGFGVVSNTIFSVMRNEDFSHDLFHYYSSKIRGNSRSWLAEEGFAYCWGDAYYTKLNGDSISQRELINMLKLYVAENKNVSFLELFVNEPKLFKTLPENIGFKKIIASIICNEVEKRKGIDGVLQLLRCGEGEDNFFLAVDKLIGVNKTNLDMKLIDLL